MAEKPSMKLPAKAGLFFNQKRKGSNLPTKDPFYLPSLKMDGWKTIRFLLGFGLFSGAFDVSFRECILFVELIFPTKSFPIFFLRFLSPYGGGGPS